MKNIFEKKEENGLELEVEKKKGLGVEEEKGFWVEEKKELEVEGKQELEAENKKGSEVENKKEHEAGEKRKSEEETSQQNELSQRMLRQEESEQKELVQDHQGHEDFPLDKGQGMVISVHKDRYELLEHATEQKLFAKLRPAAYYRNPQAVFPTVGDEVVFERNRTGDSIIVETLPRSSCFLRANPSMGLPDQAVAANFDYVFLVMSLNRDFHLGKLTRYLAAASKAGGTAVLLLSKADLVDEEKLSECIAQVKQLAPKLFVLTVSTYSGIGMEELRALLSPGKKAVFLGSSGVGKSSLINFLMGEEVMAVGEIREYDSQGRHTTTSRQCFFLQNGAVLMDTPGMRSIMMSRTEGEFSDVFGRIEWLMGSCRFSNCTHSSEPGCAVQEAIRDGSLDKKQYEEYLGLLAEERRAAGRERHRLKRLERPGKYGKKDRRWSREE